MTESQVLQAFSKGRPVLPPLEVKVTGTELRARGTPTRVDAAVAVSWDGDRYEFAAEVKARSVPKVLTEAIADARRCAEETGRLPMVVVPYLRTEQLDVLAGAKVSGLDLCGNAVIVVPKRLLVYRTGKPNRYRESLPSRFAYRGATSIVPRVFLCKPTFSSSSELQDEIRKRGSNVAASTVSKALTRMEEDLLVERRGRAVRLLQPDALLDRLLDAFVQPRVSTSVALKLAVSLKELFKREGTYRLVLSGASSAERWAVAGRADKPVLYCDDLYSLLADWLPTLASEDTRFPDVVIHATADPLPFFDVRRSDSVPYASPVETFLELAKGDKRDRETAMQVRDGILAGLRAEATAAG